jgi:putative membrane protein
MWNYGHGWGLGGGGMGFGFVFWLVIVAAIIALVVWFSRSRPLGIGERRSNGLEVLEQRYAQGEISREEYLQKKRNIAG